MNSGQQNDDNDEQELYKPTRSHHSQEPAMFCATWP